MLGLICKKLGVEIGVEWLGNDDIQYKIVKDGSIEWLDDDMHWKKLDAYEDILSGKVKPIKTKPIWKPKKGEWYWTIDFIQQENIRDDTWWNTDWEQSLFKNGLIFKTKTEAKAIASKMLDITKERV